MDYIPQWGGALGAKGQDVSGIPADDTMAQLELKRRLAQADALRQQQMPQGQMVSGRYVPPSWTQYLANAVGKYQGAKQEREALKQFGEYQKGKQAKYAEALADYEKSLKGTPEVKQGTFEIQKPVTQTQVQTSPYGTTEQLGATSPWTNNQVEGTQTVQVPMATTTMRQPTAADRYASLLKFAGATNNPELTQRAMLGSIEQANRAEETAGERAWKEKETAGERAWREQQTKNEQEFTRIRDKERNNQELTMAEKRFANEYALQKSSQAFQAGESAKNRASQLAIHNADVANRPLTESQANARLYSDRMSAANDIVTKMEPMDTKDKAGNVIKGKLNYDPLVVKSIITAPGGINDAIYAMASPENQSASQAMRDFINATLRRESGAAISAGEYDNAIRQYFPQMNEDATVTKQKQLARQRAINGIREAGGYPRGQSQQSNTKTIVRTGTEQGTGRKVVQYSDGTTEYAQ